MWETVTRMRRRFTNDFSVYLKAILFVVLISYESHLQMHVLSLKYQQFLFIICGH